MFLVLGVALVCSSIDTLQNAVVAVVSRDLTDSKIDIVQAKYVVIGIAPIAIFLAWFFSTMFTALSITVKFRSPRKSIFNKPKSSREFISTCVVISPEDGFLNKGT